MQQTGGAREAGFYRIFFIGVLALVLSLLLAVPGHAATAVGATPGKFEVSNSGRASYTIPLALPPGINGVQPSLALRYRSGSGNGLLGLGWSISGLPVIHRCNQTKAQNGESHGVDYSDDDRLCLNGNQLRAVSGNYWVSGTEYRTERERFVRITQHGSGANIWFEVEYKNGKTAQFGNSTDSAINVVSRVPDYDFDNQNPYKPINAIRLWAISKLSDRNNNAVVYHYTEDADNGSYRPDYIEYTTHNNGPGFYKVTFNYTTTRPDSIIAYYGGAERSQYARLNEVTVTATANNSVVRRYAAAYKTDVLTGKSQLTSITECASANDSACFKPTTFSGQAAASGWAGATDESPDSGHAKNSARTADINQDGIADLLYGTSPADYTQSEIVVRFGTPQGLSSTTVPTGIVPYSGSTVQQWYVVNMDRNGRPALLLHTKNNYGVVSRYQNGRFIQQTINLPDALAGLSDNIHFADFNNDGRDDIVYFDNREHIDKVNKFGIFWGTENGWSGDPDIVQLPFSVADNGIANTNNEPLAPPIDHLSSLTIADMNNDRRDEILINGSVFREELCGAFRCATPWRTEGYQLQYSSSGWQIQLLYKLPKTPVIADVNGDGYPDVAGIYNVLLNNGRYPATRISTKRPALIDNTDPRDYYDPVYRSPIIRFIAAPLPPTWMAMAPAN